MLDDFDLPGLDDLLDLLGDLAGILNLDGDDLIDLDQPFVPLWPGAGDAVDFAEATAFWHGLDAPPLDASAFGHEFGNMQLHNPFAEDLSSPIEPGSYDDLVARTAANTGIPISDFPN